MANQTALEILLKAKDETGAAFKLLNGNLKGIEQNTKQTSTAFSEMKSQAVSMAANLVSFGAAVRLVTSSLQAQAQTEASVNKLNLALANQGRYTIATSKALTDYASEMQRITTFEDDATVAAMSLLASFGMNEAQIKRTTLAAANFAAATGTDLESAVQILGKAFAGNTTALSRYGIVIDENIPKGERFEAALAQLEQRFGGQAQAAAATYTGQMKQLSNAFGDVQESLGKLIGEMANMGTGTNVLKAGLEWMSGFFGTTLVLSLGEARAQLIGFFADGAERIAKFAGETTDAFTKHPFLARLFGINSAVNADAQRVKAYFADIAASMRQQMALIREESNRAAEAVGKLLTPKNAAGGGFSGSGAGKGKAAKPEKIEFAGPLLSQIKAGWAETGPILEAQRRHYNELAGATKIVLTNVDKADAKTVDWSRSLQSISQMVQGMGGSFGKVLGSITSGIAGIGSILQGAGGFKGLLEGFGKGAGGIMSSIAGIGGVVGGIVGIGQSLWSGLKGLFSDKYKQQVTEMKQGFIESAGGMEELRKKAAAAGVDLTKFLSNTRDVTKMKDEVKKLQKAFDLQAQAQEDMAAAMQRYGITIEEAGSAWARQELDKQAAQLIKDYELLAAGGADMNAVLAKMAPNVNEYIQSALKAGQAIPQAMKPIVDQLIKEGKLVDANGEAYASAEAAGVSYAQTMTEAFSSLIDEIRALVQALGGIPSAVSNATQMPGSTQPPVEPPANGGGGGESQSQSSADILPFVRRTVQSASDMSFARPAVSSRGPIVLMVNGRVLAEEVGKYNRAGALPLVATVDRR